MEEELKRFQHPLVLAAEKKCLAGYLSSLRGYYLLLLGSHRKLSNLPPHCLQGIGLSPLDRGGENSGAWIKSAYEALAIRHNSIDIALVPYLLEYCKHADILLKELHRSLIGEGKLFIWGFERFHPWCWFNTPKPEKAFSLWGVKKLLNEADFSIEEIKHFYYGAIYFIVAKKHVSTLTPVRPQWKKKPADLKGILAGAADVRNFRESHEKSRH